MDVSSLGVYTVESQIIDRGRGPEIAGTRITVYDVTDYWTMGWRCEQIAALFRLPPDDVQAAIAYIEAHKAEVLADYQEILERQSQAKNPPDVQEKLVRSREKLEAKLAELRARQKDADTYASDYGGS